MIRREFGGPSSPRKVLKLDVDACSQTPQDYDIEDIPTLVVIREGREVGRIVGAAPLDVVTRHVGRILA